MSTEQETIDALSASVKDIDASRRVGWAKAYDSTAKLDEMARMYNLAKGDAEMWRRGASYTVGFVQGLAQSTSGLTLAQAFRDATRVVVELGDTPVRVAGQAAGVAQAREWEAGLEYRRNVRAMKKSGLSSYRGTVRHFAERYRATPGSVSAALRGLREALGVGNGMGIGRSPGWCIRVEVVQRPPQGTPEPDAFDGDEAEA